MSKTRCIMIGIIRFLYVHISFGGFLSMFIIGAEIPLGMSDGMWTSKTVNVFACISISLFVTIKMLFVILKDRLVNEGKLIIESAFVVDMALSLLLLLYLACALVSYIFIVDMWTLIIIPYLFICLCLILNFSVYRIIFEKRIKYMWKKFFMGIICILVNTLFVSLTCVSDLIFYISKANYTFSIITITLSFICVVFIVMMCIKCDLPKSLISIMIMLNGITRLMFIGAIWYAFGNIYDIEEVNYIVYLCIMSVPCVAGVVFVFLKKKNKTQRIISCGNN